MKDQRQFRDALGQFPTGVTVVTARDQSGQPAGMTANSFSSVSLDPMLVLWSIAKSASAYDAFDGAQYFAIHVLAQDQQALSTQFASKDGDRFNGMDFDTNASNVPLLNHYAARFECEVESRFDGGDHVIIVGRVHDFDSRDCEPLAFHAGRYANIQVD